MSSVLGLVSRIYTIFNPPSPEALVDSTVRPLKFGCLGAANIAPPALTNPSRSHPEVELYAVAARDQSRADAFAKKFGFTKSYGGPTGYQDLLDDPEVDAVYNPLPNGLHFEWTMKALAAGKHVLLEKPSVCTTEEATQMFAFAKGKGLILLEAFHYRFHPAIQRVKEILDSGELGTIRSISNTLATSGVIAKEDIRYNHALGGGVTMDMGTYTINCMRYLSGSNPTSVLTAEHTRYSPASRHEYVDRAVHATFALPNDVLGEINADLEMPHTILPKWPKVSAEIVCEGGTIHLYNFLMPTLYHSITVTPTGKKARVEKAYNFNGKAKGEDWWTTYRYQLEAFVDAIRGRTPQTWVSEQDSIDNMKVIESVYAKTGFGSRPKSTYTPPAL